MMVAKWLTFYVMVSLAFQLPVAGETSSTQGVQPLYLCRKLDALVLVLVLQKSVTPPRKNGADVWEFT